MKLLGIIYTVFILIFFTTIFSVASNAKNLPQSHLISEKLIQSNEINFDGFSKRNISAINENNFNIGKNFAEISFYVGLSNDHIEMKETAILEIVYLTQKLEGQPEASELQKLLKSFVGKNVEPDILIFKLKVLSNSYQERQSVEQKWFYEVGKTATNILVATFYTNETKLKADLTNLETLAKTAPKSISKEIADSMDKLIAYKNNNQTSAKDFQSINEDVEKLLATFKSP